MKALGFFLILSSIAGAQTGSYTLGKHHGASQLSQPQEFSKNFDLHLVPGYHTPRPPEANIDAVSIGETTLKASQSNPVASSLRYQAQERASFVIDPSTDPLFQGTSSAVLNPHETLQQKVQVVPPSSADSQEKIITCEESGQEYRQKCTQRLDIELRVTEEKGYHQEKWCIGHWKSKTWGTKFYCKGCRGGDYVVDQPKKVEIVREEWVGNCQILENLTEQGLCTYVNKTTSPKNETRTIQGEPITRDHFEEYLEYACLKMPVHSCAGLREKGCYQTHSACKEKYKGQCILWQQTYRCSKGKQTPLSYRTTHSKNLFCLTGDCTDTSYQANEEMLAVMSQMTALREIQQDLKKSLTIFRGEDRHCTRNCLDFRDCCTNRKTGGKGWGVDLNLSSCSAQERELAHLRGQNRCVLVGTYCAEKEKITGLCLRKKTTFCCFGSKMARLLQQSGRDQLKLSWGTPEKPQCYGLTPEQLSQIHFNKIDFSELFADIKSQITLKPSTKTLAKVSTERLQNNMELFMKPTLNSSQASALYKQGL